MGARLAKLAITAAVVIKTVSAFAPSQSLSRVKIATNAVAEGVRRARARQPSRANRAVYSSKSRPPAASHQVCAGTARGDVRLEVQRVRCDRRPDGVPFVLPDGRALRRGELRLGQPRVWRCSAPARVRVLQLRLKKVSAGSRERIPRAHHTGCFVL